jgi:hypothetical protein
MNKTTIRYIILISMIFISLGIGMYLLNNNNISKEGLDELNKQKIGELLIDRKGSQVKYKDRASTVTPEVSSINNEGIVSGVIPNIKLDTNGFALYNYNNDTYLDNNLQTKGEILLDPYGKEVRDKYKNNNFIVDTINNEGIVKSVTPKIKLTSSGYAELDKIGDLIYLDNNYNNKATDTLVYNSKQMPDVDIEYHPTEAQIIADNDYKDLKSGDIYVTDQSGNKVLLPRSNVQNSVTYYEPGVYRYSASTYVPNYEDSVYLSKSTGLSSATVIKPPYVMGGICNEYKDHPLLLEEACQKLNGNVCASTSCCVLLGGSKCVSGDQRGPTVKSNYSDIFVVNRDYYYYQGKCYGNCP